MKTLTVITTTLLMAASLLADDKKDAAKDAAAEQRFAAEKARREFFAMQSQDLQIHASMQQKANEVNALIKALQDACKAGDFDTDNLLCKPKEDAKKK